jgi:hypothetical protein
MEEPEVRAAKTESLFRDVNERIAESAQGFDGDEAAFVCECADPECTERVEAPLADYEQVRSDGAQFLLAPGHEDERIERVVRERRRFNVVRKVNRIVAAHVRKLDPRAETT